MLIIGQMPFLCLNKCVYISASHECLTQIETGKSLRFVGDERVHPSMGSLSYLRAICLFSPLCFYAWMYNHGIESIVYSFNMAAFH